MAHSKKKKSKKQMKTAKREEAVTKYIEENSEIAQAIEVMKETLDVRNLHPIYLDRYSYQSVQ